MEASAGSLSPSSRLIFMKAEIETNILTNCSATKRTLLVAFWKQHLGIASAVGENFGL